VFSSILKLSLLGIITILFTFGIVPDLYVYGQESIRVVSSSSYQDDAGYGHIIGEVENNSPDTKEFVKITSSVYDSANRIVETAFTYTDVDVLRPGEKSPFDIILDDKDQISKVSRYELSVSSVNSDPKPSNLKLTIGDNYYDDLGYAHVLGEVTNQGSENTQYAKVSGTFYNDQKKVVGAGFTFTEPSDLEPGQSAPFDLLLSEHASPDKFGKMSSGTLNAQSQQYAMLLPATIFKMDGGMDDRSSRSGDNGDGGSSSSGELEIDVNFAKSTVVRGNPQSITVTVSNANSDEKIEGAEVQGKVRYASGSTDNDGKFGGSTDSKGKVSHTWTIGPNSNPGTFTAIIDVSDPGYGSGSEEKSFKVITKADAIPTILPSKELICNDGKDNDVDGLVDSEDPDCQLSIDPCIENPQLPECLSVDPCEDNPDLPECQPIDPCIENPDSEDCESSPPIDPCDENPDSEECNPDELEPEPDPEPEPEPDPDPGEDEGDSSDDGDGDETNSDFSD
jgi:hypothetical protein